MGDKSNIEWTDATWNPWMGCKKVSQGCKNCYMFREQRQYGRDPNVVVRSKTMFEAPLKWKEPKRIFTCSWSDFFIEEASGWRAEAWEIIRKTPQHTYQILTKRPELIKNCLPDDWGNGWDNVWLGVSVEDQKAANLRIPQLLGVQARVRFLSCEPLLGVIDLTRATPALESGWDYINDYWDDGEPEEFVEECEAELDWVNYGDDLVYNPEHREWVSDRQRGARWHTFRQEIDWVIIGGESGPGHRGMELEWAGQIVELCRGMKRSERGWRSPACFVKQLGGWPDKKGDPEKWPEELRVREMPGEGGPRQKALGDNE